MYIQLICSFGRTIPLKLAWLSSLHTVLGGSTAVASAMVFTVISDVVSETGRYVKVSFSFVHDRNELGLYYETHWRLRNW
jgi:hypothetical protein